MGTKSDLYICIIIMNNENKENDKLKNLEIN